MELPEEIVGRAPNRKMLSKLRNLTKGYVTLDYPEVAVLSKGNFSTLMQIYAVSKKLRSKRNRRAKQLGNRIEKVLCADAVVREGGGDPKTRSAIRDELASPQRRKGVLGAAHQGSEERMGDPDVTRRERAVREFLKILLGPNHEGLAESAIQLARIDERDMAEPVGRLGLKIKDVARLFDAEAASGDRRVRWAISRVLYGYSESDPEMRGMKETIETAYRGPDSERNTALYPKNAAKNMEPTITRLKDMGVDGETAAMLLARTTTIMSSSWGIEPVIRAYLQSDRVMGAILGVDSLDGTIAPRNVILVLQNATSLEEQLRLYPLAGYAASRVFLPGFVEHISRITDQGILKTIAESLTHLDYRLSEKKPEKFEAYDQARMDALNRLIKLGVDRDWIVELIGKEDHPVQAGRQIEALRLLAAGGAYNQRAHLDWVKGRLAERFGEPLSLACEVCASTTNRRAQYDKFNEVVTQVGGVANRPNYFFIVGYLHITSHYRTGEVL